MHEEAASLTPGERTRTDPRLRRRLAQTQGLRCIYTGDPLETDDLSIDHVIPHHIVRTDLAVNLVVTSRSVNSDKNGHLPSPRIITLWHGLLLRTSGAHTIRRQREDTIRLLDTAERAYRRAAAGDPLWDGPGRHIPLDEHVRAQAAEVLHATTALLVVKPRRVGEQNPPLL